MSKTLRVSAWFLGPWPDFDGDFLAEFRDEKSLLLKIDLAAAFACRVEFGCADTVGIPATYLAIFTSYFTCSCHIVRAS